MKNNDSQSGIQTFMLYLSLIISLRKHKDFVIYEY